MASQWYYAQNGQQQGPLSSDQLRSLLATGAVRPTDLVWKEGLPAWTPAHQVQGLMPAPAPVPAYAPPAYAPPPPAYAPPPPAYAPPPPAFAPPSFTPPPARAGSGLEGVSEEVIDLLRMTKPWVRFLSVLGFIGLGLLGLGCLVVLFMPLGPMGSLPIGPRIGASFAYLLMGVLQFPAVLFLHRYAGRIAQLMASGTPQDLGDALRAQKSFWKYVGVFTLVMMIFYLLVIVGVLIFAGASAFNR